MRNSVFANGLGTAGACHSGKNPSPIIGALAGDLAVAHVYVTARPENSSNNQINAYSVDLLGRLTPVEGSPFF